MIKINLLRQLEAVPEKTGGISPKRIPGKKYFYITAAVFLTLVLIPILMKLIPAGFSSQEAVPEVFPVQREVIPAKPQVKPKIVLGYAVEEIVREIQNEDKVEPRYSKYNKLSASDKVEFQLSSCEKVLSILKDVTPDEIGYTDFVFTVPGDLYLHGMAATPKQYSLLKDQLLGIPQFKAKPGILKPIGKAGIAQEFSFYGTFYWKPSNTSERRAVSKQDVPGEKSRFLAIAKASGILLTPLVLSSTSRVDINQRHIFKTQIIKCSYAEFRDFIKKLNIAKSNMGILKFSLKADGDEVITGSMDVVAYTK